MLYYKKSRVNVFHESGNKFIFYTQTFTFHAGKMFHNNVYTYILGASRLISTGQCNLTLSGGHIHNIIIVLVTHGNHHSDFDQKIRVLSI